MLKHCSARNAREIELREPDGVAARFLLGQQPGLEAQLANLADEIAYNAHDIDDGVRSGLITQTQLMQVPLFAHFHALASQDHPALAEPGQERLLLYATIRRMLSQQVYDVISATQQAIGEAAPQSAEEVRAAGAPIVCFSAGMREESQQLKSFLFANLYRHPQVVETTDAARLVVRQLFEMYMAEPSAMKPAFAQRAAVEANRPRAIADFIAGMTDRYAGAEHERLTGRRLLD